MYTFLAALTFAILYGAAENRLFKEQDTGWEVFDHFKPYHLYLVAITVLTAFLGCEGSFLKLIFLCLWTPLMLDVTWWVIRYYDFKTKQNASVLYNGETNAWHLQSDWDNCPLPFIGKPPLIFGVYWWWILFGLLLAILGLAII